MLDPSVARRLRLKPSVIQTIAGEEVRGAITARVLFFVVPLSGVTLTPRAAMASIAGGTVTELIIGSDSILRGTVIRSELTSDYTGVATVQLKQVYVGWVPKRTFSISWSLVEEGAPLTDVGQEYVFFLQHLGGESVKPTHPACSFWKLVTELRHGPLVTPYVGKMTYLTVDIPGLLGEASIYVPDLPRQRNPTTLEVMYLHKLVPAVKSLWHPREEVGLYNYGSQPTDGAPSSRSSCSTRPLRAAGG